jgi:HlyD family secretion protein
MRWVKITLVLALVAAVVAAIVGALMPKPVPVETGTVEQGLLRVTIDEDGRTRVQDRHIITAPLSGNLARIELEPGTHVDEGTVLAHIEPIPPPLLDARARSELQARMQAAEATVRQAGATIARADTRASFSAKQAQRLRTLQEAGNASSEEAETAELEATSAARDRDSAKFSARVAKYELEMAKAALARSAGTGTAAQTNDVFEIRSPIVGTVLRILRESEGVITAATAIMEVADPHALEIVVDVLTSDAVEIEPGDAVIIERWGGEGTLAGHVELVEPSAFTKVSSLGVEEQRVNVIIQLDDPYEKWLALGDGYAVEAAIVVFEDAAAVQVPTSALLRNVDGWSVFVIEDGAAKSRPVEIGRRGARSVQILDGVAPGETLVVHPSDRVRDGTKVEPL